jgi:hypothetical protein
MQKIIVIAIAVAAAAAIAWALMRTTPESVDQAPEPVGPVERQPTDVPVGPAPSDPRTPPPAFEPDPELLAELPPLEDSDPFVREQLEPMDLPAHWLDQGSYVRRLAVLGENASRGLIPRRQLAFLAPNEPFVVAQRDERMFIDPVSYTRYDAYVDRLAAISPDVLARLVLTLDPLLEAALLEVGVQAPPGEVFTEAIRQSLSAPVLEGDVELVQPGVMYRFADPELEGLPQLQKQLLRMGPGNLSRFQAYLRQLAMEMNLDV